MGLVNPISLVLLVSGLLLLLGRWTLAQDIADCSWEPLTAKLSCNLKTLQTGPAVIPQVENSKILDMRCSDLSLYESLVRPDQFGTLSNLDTLTVDYCKIRNLPDGAFVGLRNLKRLSVQGHLSAWSGSMTMQLHANTLKNLDRLEQLDLSDNNIWGLPPTTLCKTPILRSLNLTRNNIVEVSEIGLTDNNNLEDSSEDGECQLLHLKVLDLSYNKISSFLPRDLSLAPGIRELNLRGNRISVLADQSLTGLWSLSSLDLASNQLAAVPPTFFAQANNLQKLFLENNTLSLLAPDTFAGLDNLLLLNMSRNALTSHMLTDSVFSGLSKLVALDLSHNSLSRIGQGLFRNQMSLQILNLQNNEISSLAASSLDSLVNLHILLLSWNQIRSLPEAVLANLASLSSLSLDHNILGSLSDNLLASTPHLQDLALNHNQLEAIPAGIGWLTRLRTLDLGENSISILPAGFFTNLTSLYGLRLAGNQLATIPADIFANNTNNLHVLNLAHNRIADIAEAAFKPLANLRALRLDNNRLTDINGVVASAKHLQWLNVSANRLQWFDFAFIPKSLEWLDVHNNEIDRIGNYYSIAGKDYRLQTFDASYNAIGELGADTLLHSLRSIFLNNNRIKRVAPGSFKALQNLSRVELQGNQLAGLEMAALQLHYSEKIPEFLVGGNPWICDCELEWMKNIHQMSADGVYPRLLDLDTIMCSRVGMSSSSSSSMSSSSDNTSSSSSSLVPLLHMRSEEFLCQYDAHCIPQCFCCDFFACDCRMQCPEGCACYHDNSWSNNIIQCSHRGHMDVPPLIPMDATTVYLDGNNMTELANPGFIGRRRVRTVYLNNSMIRRVTNFSFEGLTEVRTLHLEDNRIEQLAGGNEFAGLTALKELFLQNNYITAIHRETFSRLHGLTVLRLDGNLLTTFPVWELTANPMLVGLYLARNMWSCECDYVRPFLKFTDNLGSSKVVDGDELRCVADHFRRGEALASMENIVCAGDDRIVSPDFQSSSLAGLDYTPILVSVLLAVLVIVIGYLVAFTFRKSIKEWMFKTKSGAGGSDGSGGKAGAGGIYSKDKLFDVFISYALDDADFVEQSFAPALEHGTTSYRLCLHQRDFPPTTPVADTVSVAVESSTRAVIVLSSAYVHNNQWSSIRDAFMEAIRINNTKVVFIQLEEVDFGMAGADDLRHLLEDSPTVRWADPGFWNKLRYFLPEPVYLTFHRNVTMRGTLQTSSNLYQPVLGSTNTGIQQQQGLVDANNALVMPKGGGLPAITAAAADSGSHLPYQQYGSEHTYHSIDNNHIYHTLDPGSSNPNLFLQFQSLPAGVANRVFINHNLDVVGGSVAQPQTLHRSHLAAAVTAAANGHLSALPPPVVSSGQPASAAITTTGHHSVAAARPMLASHGRCNSQPVSHVGSPAAAAVVGGSGHPHHHHQQLPNHAHSNSTSSAKKLLSGEDSEYIV